jgi:hypothetical protein
MDRDTIEGLLRYAAAPGSAGDPRSARAIRRLAALDRALVLAESERQTLLSITAIWRSGWQPTELARQVVRTTSTRIGKLALVAIAADHTNRRAGALDPRWISQLDGLDLPHVEASTGWLARWAEREQVPGLELVEAAVALLRSLVSLSGLPILIPPPGTRADPEARVDLTARTNDPMLNRVRALLAQAESTTFDAEAEAFTAKAQELMTRHAIDLAMVAAGADRSERPLTIRVPLDDPYVGAKSQLLHHVAKHSRCRSVYIRRYAMSSVTGFAGDVAASELLFTSLLVQAQTAMHTAAAAAPVGAPARSRSFRSAFLFAYAQRIGERLGKINAGVIKRTEAESNRSILPVLAARSSVVDATVDEMFGELSRSRARRGFDAAGWTSGRAAADRARLHSGGLPAPERVPARQLGA